MKKNLFRLYVVQIFMLKMTHFPFFSLKICFLYYDIYLNLRISVKKMLSRLSKLLLFNFRTKQQQRFISSLPAMSLDRDDRVFDHVKYLYQHRQFLIDCEQVLDFVNRLQNYLLKNTRCTVAHLQCYYKMKQMRLIDRSFKYNIYRKYLAYVLDSERSIKNQNLEKYLWFLFDESRYERHHFEEAASLYTINLHQIYQYMNTLGDLPSWEPYLRVVTMLKYLGHETTAHKLLPVKRTIERIQHKYYPYIGPLFTPQQMKQIRKDNKYQQPFLTMLCNQYLLKNTSRYDSYLQRVEAVELQKSYERILDIMVWSELPIFLELTIRNYKLNGADEDIQNRFSQIFQRLTEQADIDIETITQLLTLFGNNPDFMYLRRSPIIERCLESLFRKGIDQYSYLSGNNFAELLKALKFLDLSGGRLQGYQKNICKKVQNKLVWDDGEAQALCEYLQKQNLAGGLQVLTYLKSLERQR